MSNVTDREYSQAIQTLLTTINLCCPTGENQRAFVAMLHSMEGTGASKQYQISTLCDSLVDGLRYGNWPT